MGRRQRLVPGVNHRWPRVEMAFPLADNERGDPRTAGMAARTAIGRLMVDEAKSGTLWMDEPRESELIQASQAGDREAYRQLVRHYQGPVYRLAYALTRNHDDATALAVETFGRGLTEIGRLPAGKRYFPWLLRFARNLSVTHARRRAEEEAATGSRAGAPRPGELEQRLLDALGELRPDEQMALALRVGERLPYAEIAALLDHSAGVTLARLSSARALLLTRTREGIGDLS